MQLSPFVFFAALAFGLSACGSLNQTRPTANPSKEAPEAQTTAFESAPLETTETAEEPKTAEEPESDEDEPEATSLREKSNCIGAILPTTGRSRRLGSQLAELARLHPLADDGHLHLFEAATAEEVEEAIEQLQEDRCFGAAGLFDKDVAKAAAKAAAKADFPLIMLTVSDAPLQVEGPVYRALHTPSLVVRSLAGAALERKATRAIIARGEDAYGRSMAKQFSSIWKASGGRIVDEVTWENKDADWNAVAERIQKAEIDCLFIPANVTESATLLSHLAAQGVWAKGAKPRFKGEKHVQEVTVLGPAEWYNANLLKQAGHYAEETLIAVPFALETAPGAQFASLFEGLDHPLTAYDALLSDALYALDRAARSGDLSHTRYQGATAGLDLSKRDALPALMLMTVRKGRFVPALSVQKP